MKGGKRWAVDGKNNEEYGILALAATPRDIISRLNAELNKVIIAPDMKEKMAANGVDPLGGTPEQFRDFIAANRCASAR